jgi:hypothetical protein
MQKDWKAIIAALIAKAESTDSLAERDTFMAKALELMEKHQIEMFDLHVEDPIGFTLGVEGQAGPPSYKPMVQRALHRYYGGSSVIWNTGVGTKFVNHLFGPDSSRLTTELMTPFVWNQVVEQGKVWAREFHKPSSHGTRKVANALCLRIQRLIAERKLTPEQAEKTCFSLTVVDATKAFRDSYYSTPLKTMSVRPKKISLSATKLAEGIKIDHQLGGGKHSGHLQ